VGCERLDDPFEWGGGGVRCKELESALAEATGEIEAYREEMAQMRRDREAKVMHVSRPPPSTEQAELKQLRIENEAMKQRIQANVGGDTLALEEEVTVLKKTVQDGGKKEQRLKEMFNLKIQQFRAAVLQLFGFEINWKDKTFRLRPVYAESEEDVFIFQEAKKGLQMLDAPYCTEWQAEIQTYVIGAGSIPGFLSCVCQDLFNRQTMTMGIPNLSHLSAP